MVVRDPVVDDPCPTALSVALGRPAKLAAATRAGNHIPGVQLFPKEKLEVLDRILTEEPKRFVREIRVLFKNPWDILPQTPIPASGIVILSMMIYGLQHR